MGFQNSTFSSKFNNGFNSEFGEGLGRSGGGLALPSLTSLLTWQDASDTSAGSIVGWVDKTGHGNTFTEASVPRQPTCIVKQINGRPALSFVKTNNSVLVPPTAIQNAITRTTAHTMFFCFKAGETNDSNGDMIISSAKGGAGSDLLAISIKSNTLCVGYYNGTTYNAASTSFSDTLGAHVLSVSHAADSAPVCLLDGVSLAGTTSPFANTTDGCAIGASTADENFNYTGLFAEILIYSAVLSSPIITSNNLYLKTKWGTP